MSDIDEEEAEEEVGPNLGVSFFHHDSKTN